MTYFENAVTSELELLRKDIGTTKMIQQCSDEVDSYGDSIGRLWDCFVPVLCY